MLKRMILINSANFQFADVDLSKEVFFVGDNASGKTTTTRAIHFLYNGNGEKLGIPRSKDSFAKHYFPNDDSYIIYIFEEFFIFTYKRSDTIRRWFSKQEFNLDEIIKNGKLLEFQTIINYIKKASLKVKPNSILSYTDILYGKDKKYLDFSIAKIDNYKIFLELFNMIFNVDKAIVTAIDIKKAIQKSLDRKDEVLSIDYDEFSRKLNEFSRAYNFFKTFDSNRTSLSQALVLKSNLFSLENKIASTIKAIKYRAKIENREFDELNRKKSLLKDEISAYKTKVKRLDTLYSKFEKRLKDKTSFLDKEIIELELLKEKFDNFEVERNIELASRFNSIEKELDDKKFELKKLEEELSSAEQSIKKQIEQIEYKIKVAIPNEMSKKLFDLSEVEKSAYEEEKLLIENEFSELENELNEKIDELDIKIETKKTEIDNIEINITNEIRTLRATYNEQSRELRIDIKSKNKELANLGKNLQMLKVQKEEKDNELRKNKNRYKELRKSNCKTLLNTRRFLNQQILNAKGILYPTPNSFKEFLTREIEDWESEIYPIIDKSLLSKSCDELNPQKLDIDTPISFTINKDNLETIPTKDEAVEIIKKARIEKFEALKNSKAVYKDEVAKINEDENRIIADIESIETQINDTYESISKASITIDQIESQIEELENALEKDIDEVYNVKYKEEKNSLVISKEKLEEQKKEIKTKDLPTLRKKRVDSISERAKIRDNNIKIIESTIEKEKSDLIEKENREINELNELLKKNKEDEVISSLSSKVRKLQEEYNNAVLAKNYLDEYDENKDRILELPKKDKQRTHLKILLDSRHRLLLKIHTKRDEKQEEIDQELEKLSHSLEMYDKGIRKHKKLDLKEIPDEVETNEYLFNLINSYEDLSRGYANEKSKFRTLIDKLRKLEKHSLIEINFNSDTFDEVESISELSNILDSLDELDKFEKNKYESEKKRRHNNFDTFLKNTIPSKLQSFDDLEHDFEKAKNSINKSLGNANFGVIKNIRLDTESSKKRSDTIASLMQQLSSKVTDTVKLYSNKSLFYYDVPRSVDNINDIQEILDLIKEKGSKGMINLFDTIDLGISYTENGKKIENKQNIKDDSSSGGNILLKVAIAMSILNRYAKKTNSDTPFFLIIDEVSKLQSKNQNLIKDYINSNGFKTLFITPDPAYPDPDKAIYYTFKNIQEEGDYLEIRQMNII